jgi:hypothetical protein
MNLRYLSSCNKSYREKSECKNGADEMVPFQLMTSKVLKQVKETKGVMNYAVKADFSKKHFWTLASKNKTRARLSHSSVIEVT